MSYVAQTTIQHPPFVQISGLYTPLNIKGGLRGSDRMVDGFTTTCAISAYYH